jgi:hypothetical protein
VGHDAAMARATLSGERLEAPAPPLRLLRMNRGSFSSATNPSFMSPVVFPAGCWRLRARVGDISLIYVVSVVVRQALESSVAKPDSSLGSADARRRLDRRHPRTALAWLF